MGNRLMWIIKLVPKAQSTVLLSGFKSYITQKQNNKTVIGRFGALLVVVHVMYDSIDIFKIHYLLL
jgi:hypothetical protein